MVPVLCLSTPRVCYFAVPWADSSGCQRVYLDGDLKAASLEPLSPETAENNIIVSFSWQSFSFWKIALLSSLGLLPFKPSVLDCCNCSLGNQVPILPTIWVSFSILVFLKLCWLWPRGRNLFHVSSVYIYIHVNECTCMKQVQVVCKTTCSLISRHKLVYFPIQLYSIQSIVF